MKIKFKKMCRNAETYVQPQNMDEMLGKITQQSIF